MGCQYYIRTYYHLHSNTLIHNQGYNTVYMSIFYKNTCLARRPLHNIGRGGWEAKNPLVLAKGHKKNNFLPKRLSLAQETLTNNCR